MSKPFNRPSQKPQGTPLPPKYRFLKRGTMIFELTKQQRAKLLLGYNVQITVDMRMEHNPGRVDVSQRIDVTEQVGFAPGSELSVMKESITVVAPDQEKKEEAQ